MLVSAPFFLLFSFFFCYCCCCCKGGNNNNNKEKKEKGKKGGKEGKNETYNARHNDQRILAKQAPEENISHKSDTRPDADQNIMPDEDHLVRLGAFRVQLPG